jgi:signal transduction histidine kinase
MEQGRLSVEAVPASAVELVSDSVATQLPLAAAASLSVQLDLAPDLPEIRADRDRFSQIFENLIGNAMKFTKAGGMITIGAAPRESDVLFWVTDTGVGIAAEDLPHVFDHFWQAQKGAYHGAGLGLPIVKGLIEAHGGRVWVESTPGRGSTFSFTLPATLGEAGLPAR